MARKTAKKTATPKKKTKPTSARSAARKKVARKTGASKPKTSKSAAKRKSKPSAPAKKSKKKATEPSGRKSAPAAVKTAAGKPSKPKSVSAAKTNKKAPAKPTAEQPKKRHIPDINRPTGMYGGVVLSENPKPFPRSSPYSRQELASLKEALLSERGRLRRELATMESMTMGGDGHGGSKESPGFPTHIAEYAAEMQATETILGVRTLEEERLEQVEEALARIEEKKRYGLCLACGEKIGIERLIAKPHAHLCMDCRRRYEKRREAAGGYS
jgi:DnaK suppressor protein